MATKFTPLHDRILVRREEEVLGIVTGTTKKESVIARETVGPRK